MSILMPLVFPLLVLQGGKSIMPLVLQGERSVTLIILQGGSSIMPSVCQPLDKLRKTSVV